MADSTFTFRVDDELKASFADVAAAQERTAAQLLRTMMRETVERERDAREHDAWFRSEVGRGVAEADDSDVRRVPHDEFRSSWHQQRASLERRGVGSGA